MTTLRCTTAPSAELDSTTGERLISPGFTTTIGRGVTCGCGRGRGVAAICAGGDVTRMGADGGDTTTVGAEPTGDMMVALGPVGLWMSPETAETSPRVSASGAAIAGGAAFGAF